LTESENGEGKIRTSGGPNVKAETPLKCRLATCSYKAFEPSMGHAVRITRTGPKWALGFPLAGTVMELAPSWRAWHLRDTPVMFGHVYRAKLEHLGVERIIDLIDAMVPTGPVILLCYEADRANCHRGIFASWWRSKTGQDVRQHSATPPCQFHP
jgi:hypothetical protein